MNEETDYSDYEFQQVQASINFVDTSNTNNPSTSANFEYEPLGAIGGLDNNEVAELVAVMTEYYIEHENENNVQGLASSAEMRGVLGANLPASKAVEPSGQNSRTIDGEQYDLVSGQESDYEYSGRDMSDDRIFLLFAHTNQTPFSDAATGTGGGGDSGAMTKDLFFRDVYNRGPVLDSSDNVSVNMTFNADDTEIPISAQFRAHMVWDVAEVSDAGRAFSVPR